MPIFRQTQKRCEMHIILSPVNLNLISIIVIGSESFGQCLMSYLVASRMQGFSLQGPAVSEKKMFTDYTVDADDDTDG